jgi:hypothetical protein
MIEDVSDNGVGVRMHSAVPVGTKLKIKFKNRLLSGEVRHCTSDTLAYYIGVLLEGKENDKGMAA